MKSHPLVWYIDFIRLRRGTNATSIEVASNSCRRPTVIKGQGIENALIGEYCQRICIGDHFNQSILCLVSGKLSRAQFIDAVKFQSGWYHGLHLNDQARPDMCSGRAFCLYTDLYDRHESVLPTLLHSYPKDKAR